LLKATNSTGLLIVKNKKGDPVGKGLDNWHQISIKISQVMNTGDFPANYFTVRGLGRIW
jgi:hypothetical protein